MGKGIGGHHRGYRGLTNEWFTPPEILAAVGPIDDDPADGTNMAFFRSWRGFVYINPPYGPDTRLWLQKLADHGNGIALTFARTETTWFFSEVWEKADALFFIKGRLHFFKNGARAKHDSGGPSVLIGYGWEAASRLGRCCLAGHFVRL